MHGRRRSYWWVLLATAVTGAALVSPGVALGQDALSNPTAAQYEPQSQVQGTNTTGSGPVAGNSTGGPSGPDASGGSAVGSLPFTGMDLGVIAGTALALILSGFVLRRLSAPRSIT
jgi:hypothetical protein